MDRDNESSSDNSNARKRRPRTTTRESLNRRVGAREASPSSKSDEQEDAYGGIQMVMHQTHNKNERGHFNNRRERESDSDEDSGATDSGRHVRRLKAQNGDKGDYNKANDKTPDSNVNDIAITYRHDNNYNVNEKKTQRNINNNEAESGSDIESSVDEFGQHPNIGGLSGKTVAQNRDKGDKKDDIGNEREFETRAVFHKANENPNRGSFWRGGLRRRKWTENFTKTQNCQVYFKIIKAPFKSI